MFQKILIANRGEIAVRIMRSCRELEIPTAAVYSDADRGSLHVRYADEAYYLGPSRASESYLNSEKILAIAKQCEADAIHPGYGFLAEQAEFARACQQQGLTFIGPHPEAISAMGDKQTARSTVARAGVPVVPGTDAEEDLSDRDLMRLAPEITFPLLIKPSAGGGGKGMREAASLDEMENLLSAARREAEASFGDGRIYLEKLIPRARHIEIQILADSQGNIIHLGERECSIQRRHQKLVEEAPSPLVAANPELRQTLGQIGIQAARSVEYLNAGTIEFLVDEELNCYFLEMNTRLQVEHPVTEAVTGLDLVREQIRIAAGKPLSRNQEEISLSGWAMECRINAEDPLRGFMPSTGQIRQSLLPSGPGIRVDSGVYPGFEISPYYDSLLAKLIVHGSTRERVINRMKRALEEYRITGVGTNLPFHMALMDQPDFRAGRIHTGFVDQVGSGLFESSQDEDLPGIAALAAVLAARQQSRQAAVGIRQTGGESNPWKMAGRRENMGRQS